MSNVTGTLYELIGLPNYAPVESVKQRYQQLVKSVHPDKLQQTTGSAEQSSLEFIQLKRAWDVLGEEESKKEYDIKLKQAESEQDYNLFETISVDDFSESVNGEYIYLCRCGGEYETDRNELDAFTQDSVKKFILDCSNCSLSCEVFL